MPDALLRDCVVIPREAQQLVVAASSEPERINSFLTALATGKRNTSPWGGGARAARQARCGGGASARRQRCQLRQLQARERARAQARQGGGLAAIFKPTAAPADEFEDDGVEHDLEEVALEAVVLDDDDEEELALALDALAAEGDAVA